MPTYRVVKSWIDDSRLMLECSAGLYHLARYKGPMPMPMPTTGAVLTRVALSEGLADLQCQQSGAVYRVAFEVIGTGAAPRVSAPFAGLRQPVPSADPGMARGCE